MTTCTTKLELGSCARALYDWEGSELQHLDHGMYSQLSRSDSLLLTLFCSVLFCSLAVLDPRAGHTVDVLSPFISVILTDSSTDSPVHVFMLSIQAVRGLPRLRAPGIVPCIISFSRQLPLFPHGVTIVC